MKFKSLYLFAAIGLFAFVGCQNNDGFQTTPSGLQYKIIVDQPGDSTVPGDYMKVSIRKVVDDTTLLDTHKEGFGYRWIQLQSSLGQQYDVMEGLALLTKGDSAEFKLPVNGVKNRNRPSFVEEGDILHYFVKVLDVKSQKDFETAMAKKEKEQNKIDADIIKKYVDSLGAQPLISSDGVYVIVHQKGAGADIKDGETVSIKYTGETLDGNVFDSNQDTAFHHTDPLIFPLGRGKMIKGIESGIALLKSGAEATLLIPSSLAYGRRGRLPQIKPNAILRFDLKILDVKE